ncbi:hypothetical protein YC2023_112544 [Brassica napus]|uniref:(rape) hypothetical protein n=1 Tax=Brassica napus TaxID=3708 RepID=A0A816SQL8_BRANA|nr:unnamed protein product [Brassica napus]CAF2099736.1 unnamed protein product [Brassica napus]
MQLSSELFSHTEIRCSASDLDRTNISAHRSGMRQFGVKNSWSSGGTPEAKDEIAETCRM